MSEVYAWTIDFFGIQKGDYYKVVYEDLKVDGKSIGVGKVLAACFHHMGNDLYAFQFTSNGETGYYDEKAQNLQRAFLKAPLRFKRISSKFSQGRMHPILKIRRPHLGVDYAADYGTPVQTIGEGTVIEKGWNKGGGGNYIKIKHNGAYTTLYMHLAGFAKGLKTGSRVHQGDVIGYVGSTGLSTGPHLDFRVFLNGQAIDPLKVESPPSEPVGKEYLEAFNQLKDSLMVKLNPLEEGSGQPLIVNR
jgi:murein DD-endopeptidase MepM/ murein hydrolase activator NlpD